MIRAALLLWLLLAVPLSAQTQTEAQTLTGLARLLPEASAISEAGGGGVAVTLALSQAVPWRVRVLDAPPRVVIDAREVDWARLAQVPRAAAAVTDLRAGVFRPGWSRLVLELAGPHLVTAAELATADATGGAGATLRLTLTPASTPARTADFAAAAALPEPPDWALPAPAEVPPPALRGTGPVIVVLDPGHGGLDPGAERDGQTEAALMLTFARALKEELLRDPGLSVVLTRDEDAFVPLETRISLARAAGAHLFLSLHADALAEGEASGATLYTLSEDASDAASATLAERHDRDDLLAGVDLTQQDDLVASVLMDMARTTTEPRTERLALALEAAIKSADIRMHRAPRQTAGFSVLKSPDIPSVLIELGFLSSARDLARLSDPDWRARMAAALRAGITAWAAADTALRALPAN